MRNSTKVLLLSLVLVSQTAFGQELMYPELQVTPRASERLKMEAEAEPHSRWTNHLPVQVSALSTFVAGVYAPSDLPKDANDKKKDQNAWASRVAMGVGAGWLVATYMLSSNYTPYQTAYKENNALPTKNKQEQLMKERMAEEALARPASLGTKLTWISVFTNLGAAAFVMGSSGSKAQIVGGVAAALAFTPLLFPYDWSEVYGYHKEYKKKIYGPVASAALLPVGDNKFVPGMSLDLSF